MSGVDLITVGVCEEKPAGDKHTVLIQCEPQKVSGQLVNCVQTTEVS